MSEKVNCPFCGNIVESDAIKCSSCGSLFADPELPNLKFKEFATFFALLVLTFGLFGIIWVFLNIGSINKLATTRKDCIKLNVLVTISILDIAAYIFCLAFNQIPYIYSILTIIQCFIFMALTYRILRIIQKYTQRVYNVTLEYNFYYIVIFNMLYLIHFIDTYSNRVLQIHEHFNPKSPQMVLLVLLLLIIQFLLCWDTDIHQFYRWLFGV